MCDNVAFLATGFNPDQLNRTLLTTLGNHIPAGTSAYTILHFAQGIATSKFSTDRILSLDCQNFVRIVRSIQLEE